MLPKGHGVVGIKYFTAKVSPSHSDPSKQSRQNLYVTALKKYNPNFEVIYGQFSRHLKHEYLAPSDLAKLPEGTVVPGNFKQSSINTQWVSKDAYVGQRVDIVKTEEKGSDVNLAIHMLDDAWQNKFDCAVVISNDSDLAGAMDLVLQRPNKTIGLMTASKRPTKLLGQKATFHRRISERYLKKAQLPDVIPGTNISKPAEWTVTSRKEFNLKSN